MIISLIKWLSWITSAIGLAFMFLGSLAYLMHYNIFLGAHWGTFYLFGGYVLSSAVVLILLYISCKITCKD